MRATKNPKKNLYVINKVNKMLSQNIIQIKRTATELQCPFKLKKKNKQQQQIYLSIATNYLLSFQINYLFFYYK